MTRATKKRRGRPKGSRNKIQEVWNKYQSNIASNIASNIDEGIPTEPPSYLSRLEAATVKYETAINNAISALKGN